MKLRTIIMSSFAVGFAAIPPPALAQPAIDWSTIDCGGGQTSGGTFSLNATIAQPDAAAPLTGGTFTLTGGFWPIAPCTADFNGSGAVTVQDIFDFLGAYFSADPNADVNSSGVITVQDIFDFLGLYFAGCP